MILNEKWLNDLSAGLKQIFAGSPAQDIEKNVRALLSSAFGRLNLVTREEFDAQSAVLARTREKLEQLEQRLEQITQLDANSKK
jgi:BMFP domain-containing protein YqiC